MLKLNFLKVDWPRDSVPVSDGVILRFSGQKPSISI